LAALSKYQAQLRGGATTTTTANNSTIPPAIRLVQSAGVTVLRQLQATKTGGTCSKKNNCRRRSLQGPAIFVDRFNQHQPHRLIR
jgi:hypothetical protein